MCDKADFAGAVDRQDRILDRIQSREGADQDHRFHPGRQHPGYDPTGPDAKTDEAASGSQALVAVLAEIHFASVPVDGQNRIGRRIGTGFDELPKGRGLDHLVLLRVGLGSALWAPWGFRLAC